jgi:hypothetical protein
MNTDAPKGKVIFSKTVKIGTIPYGQRTAPLTVEIEYGNKLNPTHKPTLSITGHYGYGNSGGWGQIIDELKNIKNYAPGWNYKKAMKLRGIWQRWHMNGSRAYCEHQRELGWMEKACEKVTLYHWRIARAWTAIIDDEEKSIVAAARMGFQKAMSQDARIASLLPKKVTHHEPNFPQTATAHYYEPAQPMYKGDSYSRPSEEKALGWLKPNEHPEGILTKPCPVCGYKYGSAWLHEDVPQDVLDWLQSL